MLICLCVSVGVSLASYGEANFSLTGALFVMAACCMSGLRWALTQMMMEGNEVTRDPLHVIYHISPSSAIFMVLVFSVVELPKLIHSRFAKDPEELAQISFLIGMGGIISFFLIYAEVKIIKISSSLTMGMFGNLKEVVTISVSMLTFGDKVSLPNIVGLCLAIVGAVWYRFYKVAENKRGQVQYMEANEGVWDCDHDDDDLL